MRRILIIAALGIGACSKDVSAPQPAPACAPGGPSSLTLPVGGIAAARTSWQAARAAMAAPAAVPVPGDSLNLRVPNADSTNLCTHYFTVRAVVKAVGTHAIVVQDTAAPANGFTPADFAAVSSEVDTYTYPTDTSYFGRPTDLDNNGHVFILFMQFQVIPTNVAWHRRQNVELDDGHQVIARLHRTITVFP